MLFRSQIVSYRWVFSLDAAIRVGKVAIKNALLEERRTCLEAVFLQEVGSGIDFRYPNGKYVRSTPGRSFAVLKADDKRGPRVACVGLGLKPLLSCRPGRGDKTSDERFHSFC